MMIRIVVRMMALYPLPKRLPQAKGKKLKAKELKKQRKDALLAGDSATALSIQTPTSHKISKVIYIDTVQGDIAQFYQDNKIKQQTYPQFFTHNQQITTFLSIYAFYTTIYYPPPMCWRLTAYEFDPETVDPTFSSPETNPYHNQGYIQKYTPPPPPPPNGPQSLSSLISEVNEAYPIYTHYWSVVQALLYHPSEELRTHIFGQHYKQVVAKLDEDTLNFLHRLDLNTFVEKYRYQLFFDPVHLEMLTLMAGQADIASFQLDESSSSIPQSIVVDPNEMNFIDKATGRNRNYHSCIDLKFFDDKIFEQYYLSRHQALEEQALAAEAQAAAYGISGSNGSRRRGLYKRNANRGAQWLSSMLENGAKNGSGGKKGNANKGGRGNRGAEDYDDDDEDQFTLNNDDEEEEDAAAAAATTAPSTTTATTTTTTKSTNSTASIMSKLGAKSKKATEASSALSNNTPSAEICQALPTTGVGSGNALRSISLVWYLINTVHLTIDDLSVLLQGIQNPSYMTGDPLLTPYPDEEDEGQVVGQQYDQLHLESETLPVRPHRNNSMFLTPLPFDVYNNLNQSVVMFAILRRWDENLLTFLVNTFTLDHFFQHYDNYGRNAYYYLVMSGLTRHELPQLWPYIQSQCDSYRSFSPIFDKPSSWNMSPSKHMQIEGDDELGQSDDVELMDENKM